MIQVVNQSGEKIVGLFKKADGSIVVVDDDAFKKHIQEKKKFDEINDMKNRLNKLEEIVKILMGKTHA